MKKWISVMCGGGIETVLKVDEIYCIQFGSEEILILSVAKERFSFALEQDPDGWGELVITKEELEKLRIELQGITNE